MYHPPFDTLKISTFTYDMKFAGGQGSLSCGNIHSSPCPCGQEKLRRRFGWAARQYLPITSQSILHLSCSKDVRDIENLELYIPGEVEDFRYGLSKFLWSGLYGKLSISGLLVRKT